uniref:Uncharacterized protein AlNc14C345G10844 n=1 Tax=Albugo laibachii Nc14 TaxID=890382 RepID=F0WX89_9STRA|nr:conserved hypothetical protein [Albugo laibachii Nc14]|eukprot:CCA26081.1 conserved hypothetical protein [Albugo laibachii Nc14]
MDFNKCYSILEAQQRKAAEEKSSSKCCVDIGNYGLTRSTSTEYVQESSRDLAKRFIKQQEKRSLTYKKFYRGFEDHPAEFPSFCAIMTQKFATISEEINRIEKALREQQQLEMAQLIRSIQLSEKENLFLTSGLFVEKFRLGAERRMLQQNVEEDGQSVTITLLEKSIDHIVEKHTQIVSEINELLEAFQIEANELF